MTEELPARRESEPARPESRRERRRRRRAEAGEPPRAIDQSDASRRESARPRSRRRRRFEEDASLELLEGSRTFEGPMPAVFPVELPDEHVDQDAVKVVARLTRHGYEAYLVGGGVRDLLLGRRPKDFDIATSAKPAEVRRLFRNCRVIGRRFRLAHILFAEGKIIEVATFRRDPTQRYIERPYARMPEGAREDLDAPVRLSPMRTDDEQDLLIKNDNVFGLPHEDAIRRDFTINGLFYDMQRREVIDYVGGMGDLRKKTLRTIGDPDQRFREDPVRIMRAIKFSARIDMGIDVDMYDAMVDFRGELARAARPRLFEEVLRLLRGGAAHRSVYLMWDVGVLGELLPEVASFLDDDAPGSEATWQRLRAIDRRIKADESLDDTVLFAALLLGPLEEAIEGAKDMSDAFEGFFEGLAFRLAIPRRIKDRIRMLVLAQRRLRTGR
ncbi:MAG: polynucleotide adenylyltransferase PcnB, partial [Myxococcota bacterium]